MATRAERIDALRDEHCYITSVDGCCHCGDCECDGIGCIANLDPEDPQDHEAIERLHGLLREGQAWRILQAILKTGERPLVALALAQETLAFANNQSARTLDEQIASAISDPNMSPESQEAVEALLRATYAVLVRVTTDEGGQG